LNYFNIVGYDASDLMDKLSDYNYSISRKFYNSKTHSEEYKSFLLKLFYNAEYPYTFESSVIGEWLKGPSVNLPLSKDELRDIVIGFLDEYCKLAKKLDDYLWSFLNDWKTFKYEEGREIEVIPEKAKTIFKDFIVRKDIDGFLRDLIYIDRNGGRKYTLVNYALTFWDTWESFVNILEENRSKGWKYIPEFLEFYEQLNREGIEGSIEFNFKIIPVRN
jgi:hypothetical protein